MMIPIQHTNPIEQRLAHRSLAALKALVQSPPANTVNFQLPDGGETMSLPSKAVGLLYDILSEMAEGHSVFVVTSATEMTTQQVADYLNMSRPFVVKQLEAGLIPFKKVGTHRRVLFSDVLQYENKQRKVQEDSLAFLTGQAQDLQMGYE